MVFTKLSAQEKEAFFGLLDEYFQSRPDLLRVGQGQGVNAGGLAGTGVSTATAASVVQRAFGANTASSSGGAKSNNPYSSVISATSNSNLNVADVVHAVPVGRVAAASLAFSKTAASAPSPSPSPSAAGAPAPASAAPSPSPASFLANLKPAADGLPSLPRRGGASPANASGGGSSTAEPSSEIDKLVTRKASVLNAFKKQTPGVAIPSAFVAPKNDYGPPPVRRVTSDASTGAGGGGGGSGGTKIGPGAAPRVPQRQEPEEETPEGEWVEVLYDYSSEDPGDLAIEAGMRVWVTARSSEDWWTGQIEGQDREGLFPASYVKAL